MRPADNIVAAIFDAALACRTAEDRAAYLDKACAGQPELRQRVEALLAAHEEASKFLEPKADVPRPTIRLTLPPEEQVGERIGRYKLLQKIGEGGCGVVYMAEQEEPVRRRVALKVIKLGMDTKQVVARFEAERQALALMDHPNIAKVLDAGATDQGRPFFVMELVKGIPVTRYCDENKLNTRQRLDLFIQICQAVQHAHQKGIIHRDLKPTNVLVADHDGTPVPKVIDFGIAKATTDQRLTDKTLFTALEQFIGTPAYMSPEQAKLSGLDIDTRSDIYSLGVLLYELLTGRTPFDARRLLDAGFDEIRRIIREEEPVKPSTRLTQELSATDEVGRVTPCAPSSGEVESTSGARGATRPTLPANASSRRLLQEKISLVRGDLDWIVMKCLEKDRTRRYETANGLAADVQRHLSNEPVVACPPSAAYRFQKMVRRNRAAFAIATTVVSLVVIGLSVSTWLMHRQKAAVERALAAETTARRTAEKLQAEQLLAEASERYNEVQQQMFAQLPARYYANGAASSASASNSVESLCRTAVSLLRKQEGTDLASLTYAIDLLTGCDLTNKAEVKELLNESLALKRKLYGNESLEVAKALDRVANLDWSAIKPDDRIVLLQESYAIQKYAIQMKRTGSSYSWDMAQILGTHTNLANLLKAEGRLSEFERTLKDFIATFSTGKSDDWYCWERQVELARFFLEQERVVDAETELRNFNYATNFDAAFVGVESSSCLGKIVRDVVATKIEIYSALQQTNNAALWKAGLQKLDKLEPKNSMELALGRAEAAEAEAKRNAEKLQAEQKLTRASAEFQSESSWIQSRLINAPSVTNNPEGQILVISRYVGALKDLAIAFRRENRLPEAELLYRERLAIIQSPASKFIFFSFGDATDTNSGDHSFDSFGMASRDLADILRAQGKDGEAVAHYRNCLAAMTDGVFVYPKCRWRTAKSEIFQSLVQSLNALSKTNEVQEVFEAQDLSARARTNIWLGWFDRCGVAETLNDLGQFIQAETQAMSVAKDMDAAGFGEGYCFRFEVEALHGASLLGQKKYAEAEPVLVRAYEGMKSKQPREWGEYVHWDSQGASQRDLRADLADPNRMKALLTQLVRLYELLGRADRARHYQSELEVLFNSIPNLKTDTNVRYEWRSALIPSVLELR